MSKWPLVPLGEVLTKSEEWITLEPEKQYNEVTIRLWGKGVVLRRQVIGAEIASSRRLRVRANQFILSRIDARNGAIGLVPESLDAAVVSTDFPAFALDAKRVFSPYLGWMSRTPTFVEICKKASEGTTNRVRLQEDRFLQKEIPLPPLHEQRRIVARIESLAAKIEEAYCLSRQTEAETVALRKSFITKILEGVLVAGCLGDVLLEKPRNGWSARCDNADSGIPVLGLGAVTGFRYQEREFKRTSIPVSRDGHYWLKPGDLLITRSNTPELVGHAAIYSGSPNPCIYPDLMMRLTVNEMCADTRFVHSWLESFPVRDYISRTAKGTSPTMKKISQGVVMNIPFPSELSISEQRRVVAHLDDLQSKMDALKRLQTETAEELAALLPSILDKAFKGELVA